MVCLAIFQTLTPRHSLSSLVTVFGFSQQKIGLISRSSQLYTFHHPPDDLLRAPLSCLTLLPAASTQLPPWTTGTRASPYPPKQAAPSRTTPNHRVPRTEVRAQPQRLQKHSAKVIPRWEKRRNTIRHKSGFLQTAFNFPQPTCY